MGEGLEPSVEAGAEAPAVNPVSLDMPLSVWRVLVYLFTDYGLDDYVWLVDGAIDAMTLDHVCFFRVYFNLPMPKGTAMPIDISRLYNILRRFSSRRGFLSYRFLNGSV
jgi:hypothetical protein